MNCYLSFIKITKEMSKQRRLHLFQSGNGAFFIIFIIIISLKKSFMSPPHFTETLTINPPLLPTAELCLLDA